jgi:predicted Fe-Mo cluster-binding NifX family protein
MFVDVDAATSEVIKSTQETAPQHEPGLLPRWLRERGATVIIAGGIGARAQGLFKELGIEVVSGAQSCEADAIVQDYLRGALVTNPNSCDHRHHPDDHRGVHSCHGTDN